MEKSYVFPQVSPSDRDPKRAEAEDVILQNPYNAYGYNISSRRQEIQNNPFMMINPVFATINLF